MNNQDFQNICATLANKYAEKRLTDADVDAFADVISNVLGRDDLRAEGTAYASLAATISHDYENDIAMNPLLARMYELCRMYSLYRPRPLTEMERKEEQMEIGRVRAKKYPVRISLTDGRKTLASCWWEDLGGADEIMDKISIIAPKLPRSDGTYDMSYVLYEALAAAGGGLDGLDIENIEKIQAIGGEDDVKISSMPKDGIIALDAEGLERNRARKGAEVKLDLSVREVNMDAYTVYGLDFYKKLSGDEGIEVEKLDKVVDDMLSFSFDDALSAQRKWANLGEVFALDGSDNLVGTKKPLAVK